VGHPAATSEPKDDSRHRSEENRSTSAHPALRPTECYLRESIELTSVNATLAVDEIYFDLLA